MTEQKSTSPPAPCTCGDNPNRSGAHKFGCPRFGTVLRDDNTVDPSFTESTSRPDPVVIAGMEFANPDPAPLRTVGPDRLDAARQSPPTDTPGSVSRPGQVMPDDPALPDGRLLKPNEVAIYLGASDMLVDRARRILDDYGTLTAERDALRAALHHCYGYVCYLKTSGGRGNQTTTEWMTRIPELARYDHDA